MAVDPNLPYDQKKGLLRRFADVSYPSSVAGIGGPASAVDSATVPTATANLAGISPSLAQVAQGASANQFAGVTGSAQTVRDPTAGLRALPTGVTRYQLDPGNEAEVYATRGKDGSTVFTDNPAYASAVGSGRALGPNDTYMAGERTSGPNAGFAYAGPSIGGLRRRDISTLDDATTSAALNQILTNASNDPETQAANAIDRNLLVARQQTLRRPPAGNFTAGGLSGLGNGQGLTPENQIQLLRLQQQDARAAQANQIALAGQKASVAAAERSADSSERTAQSQTFQQLQTLKKEDPAAYATNLVSQLAQDPTELRKQLKSSQGQLLKNSLLQDVIQPGLIKGTYPIEFGDRGAARRGEVDFSRLQLDPQSGQPVGFTNDGEVEYPINGFFGGPNFDPAISRITPAMWRILQEDGLNSKKAR